MIHIGTVIGLHSHKVLHSSEFYSNIIPYCFNIHRHSGGINQERILISELVGTEVTERSDSLAPHELLRLEFEL